MDNVNIDIELNEDSGDKIALYCSVARLRQVAIAVGLDDNDDLARIVYLQKTKRPHLKKSPRNGQANRTVRTFEYIFDIRNGEFYDARVFISLGGARPSLQPIGLGVSRSILLDAFRLRDERSQLAIDYLASDLEINPDFLRERGFDLVCDALDHWRSTGKPRAVHQGSGSNINFRFRDTEPSVISIPKDLSSRYAEKLMRSFDK